ncbi:hypothetical protein C463_15390 [Halorubrum californiense DSM 19288]|uniref:Rho termination factor N-terminal domain-containing protein n=1 Tax=Halorubrum californiense DSM 19288 TaxID=1227465 RepID=M0DXN7_9EURY|nr:MULTISPECIES: hypothetical protein [Halorubrum]ELZ40315.1 hypothetical protein C463_15390 [Halorubrum californiense DSM 19288]TKX65241.1 hypothetical protein EXE40_16990 [Halorubrum sp. GN11GM_10-3_MGM]
MPTLDITDDHADRIEALREELAAAHAGPYASVDREDALAYLLDLADAVDDPDRAAAPTDGDDDGDDEQSGDSGGAATAAPFDRDRARELLAARNRRDSDPDPDDPMDLSDIAAAFDVTGRSEMTKDELVDAIIDAAEALAADPFARVDVDLDAAESGDEETVDDESDDEATDDESDADGDEGADSDDDESDNDDENAGEVTDDDGGAGQLDAMMSLLDTHADKWREADGDARYEVDLPDGSAETARTKDDVRALLFKNY